MKIKGIRTRLYEVELTRPLGDANQPHGWKRAEGLAVFVDTDEGLTGIGLASAMAREAIKTLEPLIVGRDPRGVRGLWKRMIDLAFKGGNRGFITDAISSIDVALWDLKAKINNEPLWKTLGASTRRVKAYASGLDMPLSDQELRAFYEGMATKGFNAGKLKVGIDIEADLRRLGIMYDALKKSGKKPILMIDSNEYWSPKQAIRHIRFLEEHYDLMWAEEPARRWDYRGLRLVSQSVKAAVATGENLDDVSEFTPLVGNEAVDIVQFGFWTSGITGALQVADMAYAFELPVSMMNCPGNFMAHVAAVLPNHTHMEVLEAGREAAFDVDIHIEDGWIVLGDSPGHGISFSEEKLSKYEKKAPSRAGTASPWGRRRGAGLYEVGPNEPEELGEE